jgi:hypothetical protein
MATTEKISSRENFDFTSKMCLSNLHSLSAYKGVVYGVTRMQQVRKWCREYEEGRTKVNALIPAVGHAYQRRMWMQCEWQRGEKNIAFALAVYFLLEMIISVTHSLLSRNLKTVGVNPNNWRRISPCNRPWRTRRKQQYRWMVVGGYRHAHLLYSRKIDPIPTVQEAVWVSGSIWTGKKNFALTEIRSPYPPLLHSPRYSGHLNSKSYHNILRATKTFPGTLVTWRLGTEQPRTTLQNLFPKSRTNVCQRIWIYAIYWHWPCRAHSALGRALSDTVRMS